MAKMTLRERMNLYMDAGFPILYLETFEEEKAIQIIKEAATRRQIVEWNMRGLFYHDNPDLNMPQQALQEALENFASPERMGNEKFAKKFSLDRRVLVLKDAQSKLEEPEIVAHLKYLAESMTASDGIENGNIVIISPVAKIPQELEHFITILSMDHLSVEEIKEIIMTFCDEQNVTVPHEELLQELAFALKGLPEVEIRNLLALSKARNVGGEITRADLSLIHDQKEQMVRKSGIMEMIKVTESINDIGGLDKLKAWLKRKARILKDIDAATQYGVDIPKGVLIAGLPGCGKSLNAKAAASLFDVPLLRMDMGRLMGKYVGESEQNLRRAISLSEAISPCVLWIDEMEKAFAGIGGQGGGAEVTTRLFGSFLTWLQEKRGMTFVVATANDITKLPPELLRKGRFDEIFYVGLPNTKEREQIFTIHIGKRRRSDLRDIDVAKLAQRTEGYSGADIEGVVKDAIETAFTDNKSSLTTQTLLMAIDGTASLKEVMRDSIEKMSETYRRNKFKNASA